MKTYKNAIVLAIAAIVILSFGFSVQISAGKELKSRIGEISSVWNECEASVDQTTRTPNRGIADGESVIEAHVACATQLRHSETAAYGKYETWMNVTSAIFVLGVALLVSAIVTPFPIRDRNEDEAIRKEFVRMRVSSFQRRARLAKRELAMRQLELARS